MVNILFYYRKKKQLPVVLIGLCKSAYVISLSICKLVLFSSFIKSEFFVCRIINHLKFTEKHLTTEH